MFAWVPYAFVRITLSFVGGILVAIFTRDYLHPGVAHHALWPSMALCYLLVYCLLRGKFFKYHQLLSAIAWISIGLLGYWNVGIQDDRRHGSHIIHCGTDVEYYTVTLKDNGAVKAESVGFKAEVDGVKVEGSWKHLQGMVNLYVPKDASLKYGDRLIIKGSFDKIKPVYNPGEFDYRQYMSYQQVYHQDFVRPDEYKRLGWDGNSLLLQAYEARQWAGHVLAQYIQDTASTAVAQALVLGLKDHLDEDTEGAYAAAGAIHVLAVSGLHVGIIYTIIYFILSKLFHGRIGRWTIAGLCICCLWFYAAITGFSPSVIRAVTMFTLIMLARTTGRDTNIFNTLAVSAFAMLILDPYIIMSLGFQLSYLAVLGIVYLQPRLYGLVYFPYRILDKIWLATSVGLAAQLATFPLCIYYFHQFPTYFFIANLVVVPAAGLVLSLGVGLVLLSFSHGLASAVGWVLKWIIMLLNKVIFFISALPFAQFANIALSALEAVLISLILLIIILYARYARREIALLLLIATFGFSFNRIYSNYSRKNSIVIYKINKHTAVDFIKDRNSYLYTDEALASDPKKYAFHIQPNHLDNHIREVHYTHRISGFVREFSGMKLICFADKRLLIADKHIEGDWNLKTPVKVDFILIGNQFDKDVPWIKRNFKFEEIILDGSLTWRKANSYVSALQAEELPYYSVYHDGAYEISIP